MENLGELPEPLWLLTWDQLERYGPLPVRMELRNKVRLARENEPVPLLQLASVREG